MNEKDVGSKPTKKASVFARISLWSIVSFLILWILLILIAVCFDTNANSKSGDYLFTNSY